MAVTGNISGAAEVKKLLSDDFSSDSGLWTGGTVKDGQMIVSVQGEAKKFNGSRLLLNPPVNLPQEDGRALHVRFKVVGFGEIAGQKDVSSSARIFLVPEPAPKFLDPFVTPNVFSLIVAYDSARGLHFRLYRKVEEKGFGKLLYEGSLPAEDLPVQVDLFLSKDQYRMLFDKDVLSDQGSLSGYHELPGSLWSGDVRFGGRIVNERDGIHSLLTLDDVYIGISDGLR